MDNRFVLVTARQEQFNWLSESLTGLGVIIWDKGESRNSLIELIGSIGVRVVFLDFNPDATPRSAALAEELLKVFPSLWLVGVGKLDRLWLRGGFPRSFLAQGESSSESWRADLVRTYLERDLPDLGVTIPSATLRRFWTMLAHWHGQIWKSAEFARSFVVADTKVRRYLDLLAGTFMVRLLQPFHENLAKRQVKAPKVYFADSGLLHSLLGIRTRVELDVHPRMGASWEGFALAQITAHLGARSEQCFVWAAHTGAELDLLIVHGRRRLGFEIKRTEAPRVTPSMRSALADLRLDRIDVVHAGAETYPLTSRIRALALRRLVDDLAALR
jgi:predicted AAA+ superfamily ATPase